MGYALVSTTIYNAIFVRNDLLSLLPVSLTHSLIHSLTHSLTQVCLHNLSVDELHEQSMVTEMFQTYDGELKYVGMKIHSLVLSLTLVFTDSFITIRGEEIDVAPGRSKSPKVADIECKRQVSRPFHVT